MTRRGVSPVIARFRSEPRQSILDKERHWIASPARMTDLSLRTDSNGAESVRRHCEVSQGTAAIQPPVAHTKIPARRSVPARSHGNGGLLIF